MGLRMYYHGFDKKFPSGATPWTSGDDQLVGLLFTKIINRTAGADPTPAVPELTDEIAQNLFDLLLYIHKDCHSC